VEFEPRRLASRSQYPEMLGVAWAFPRRVARRDSRPCRRRTWSSWNPGSCSRVRVRRRIASRRRVERAYTQCLDFGGTGMCGFYNSECFIKSRKKRRFKLNQSLYRCVGSEIRRVRSNRTARRESPYHPSTRTIHRSYKNFTRPRCPRRSASAIADLWNRFRFSGHGTLQKI